MTTDYLLLTTSMPGCIRVCQDVYEYARMYTSMPECIRVCQNVYEYARMYQTVCRYTILYIEYNILYIYIYNSSPQNINPPSIYVLTFVKTPFRP